MMDGVVRSPSAFSITFTLSPSMMATQELVVPRSIPIILLIESLQFFLNAVPESYPPRLSLFNRYIGALIGFSSLLVDFWCIFGFGHNHHGGTNHATVQQVALLNYSHHTVRLRIWRGHHRHGLVLLRIERFTHRVHLFNIEFLEAVHEQAQGHFHAFPDRGNQLAGIFVPLGAFHRLLKAVCHRKKLLKDRKSTRLNSSHV